MQGDIHVFCHPGSVTADKKVGTRLEPIEDVLAVLEQSILDINLVRLISGESGVESGQKALLLQLFKLLLIKEVAVATLFAKEEPVFPGRAHRLSFLQVRSERS